ncbi:nuclear transport factor 2 family protein [bacterium]|nr:nuclear transport factor 2 family protein [bacterium]
MKSDIKKIEQVLYRVCHAVDQGQINSFVNLFHLEGRFIITWEENRKYTGHEEIQKWITNYDNTLRSSMKYLRHKITCPMIDVSGQCDCLFLSRCRSSPQR